MACLACSHSNPPTAKFCNERGARCIHDNFSRAATSQQPAAVQSSSSLQSEHDLANEHPAQKAKNKRYRGDECVELPNEGEDISVDFYTTQLSKLYFPESQRNNIAQPGVVPKGFMLGATRSTCRESIHLSSQMIKGEDTFVPIDLSFFPAAQARFSAYVILLLDGYRVQLPQG